MVLKPRTRLLPQDFNQYCRFTSDEVRYLKSSTQIILAAAVIAGFAGGVCYLYDVVTARQEPEIMKSLLAVEGDEKMQALAASLDANPPKPKVIPDSRTPAIVSDDHAPPVTVPSLGSGQFAAPTEVTLNCTGSRTSCVEIAYTINEQDPDFEKAAHVIGGATAVVLIGDRSYGDYTLKFRGRDAAGNLEQVKSAEYHVIEACEASRVSPNGFAPCNHECGQGANETPGTTIDHVQCECQPTHFWNVQTRSCQLISQ
jgi:hypothetical protein